jgi:hypothetical protein
LGVLSRQLSVVSWQILLARDRISRRWRRVKEAVIDLPQPMITCLIFRIMRSPPPGGIIEMINPQIPKELCNLMMSMMFMIEIGRIEEAIENAKVADSGET